MAWFRWQDVVWLVLFGALVWASPLKNNGEIEMLAAMALLQIAVPRVPALNTRAGTAVVIGLKLLIGFLLIAVTKSTDSEYTLILFLPILSAATRYGALGTSVVTVLACATYLAMWPLAVLASGHIFRTGRRPEHPAAGAVLPAGGVPHVWAGGIEPQRGAARPGSRCRNWRRPMNACARPRHPCGAASAWLLWASYRQVWRMNCETR